MIDFDRNFELQREAIEAERQPLPDAPTGPVDLIGHIEHVEALILKLPPSRHRDRLVLAIENTIAKYSEDLRAERKQRAKVECAV